jgi:glycerophosphoryl diester phosphodiesterase
MARHPFLDHPGPLAFAHRGGASEAPENTLPAFRYAVDLGYRYLETDVQSTADGVLLAFHDDDLARATDHTGKISELPHAEVRRALVDGREPIPTLDALLEEFPDRRVNIDCKTDHAVDPLIAVIRRHDCLDRVCVGAFSGTRLARLRRALGPGLCSSLSPQGVARLKAVSLVGSAARFAAPHYAQAAQIPVRQYGVTLTDGRFLRAAHRAGIQVHVWTVDDTREMIRLLDLGVDGIMTDRPAVLKQVLENRGQWVA